MHTTTVITVLAGAALAMANPAAAPKPAITPAPLLLHPHLAPRQQDFSLSSSFSDDDTKSRPLAKSVACARKIASLANGIPRETNRALARWLATEIPSAVTAIAGIKGLDDVVPALTSQCSIYTITSTLVPPASLTSAYSSYMSEASSWLSSAAPVAHSLASSCGPGQASALFELLVVSDAESCSSAVMGLVNALGKGTETTTEGTESPSATAGGTGTGSGTAAATGATTGGTGTGASAPTGTTGTAGAATTTGAATGAGMREAGRAGVVVAAAAVAAGVVALL